ncbi:iron-sulfur cluster repair di-iron protein [Bacillus timonensis]|nr:iron-sulfur cluster repair di-iron protein [Bacillus timonensis]
MFNEQSIVAEVVTKFPKASDLFKSYRIDFCCGGNKPLGEAIKERNLSSVEVIEKLNQFYQEVKQLNETIIDWNESSYSELIDYIISKHHCYLNEELPQLSPYVTKVLRVHGGHQPHLATIHQLFNRLRTELEHHTISEESEVFPKILDYETTPSPNKLIQLKKLIHELEDEHSEAGAILRELREVTNDFTPPPGACGTYRLVYQRLEVLEADLFEHIHLENNVLFPRVLEEA